ncbi:MAG: M48 family metallopeptidase [Anaerolineae bacterium]|nr:M48 family metallopeptidase [Anaerolineae bacterium]
MDKNDTNTNWPVEIVRSDRRRRTVSAELKGGTLLVRAPQVMTDAELTPIIQNLQERLAKKVAKRNLPHTDADLEETAQMLNKKYFHGRLRWQSIRYVTNQNGRFGSCTPSQGTICLNHRLATMPAWVRDYVVMHELAHLEEANHGPRFWKLVNRYHLTERARGYLMAVGLEEDEGVTR